MRCPALLLLVLQLFALHALGADLTVVLLGDSLINRPWNEHSLSSKIMSLLNTTDNITLINSGQNGEEIESILARTPTMLAEFKPWAVILFWDSDCSAVPGRAAPSKL